MPRIDDRQPVKRKATPKPKPAARRGAVGRGADTIAPKLGPPAPAPKRTGVFKPGAPRPATAPITVDAPKAAQQKVDRARRALPAATVAAPPVVSQPSSKPKPGAKTMTATQVQTFLKSQSEVTQHARKQIVGSIRKNLGNTRGRERQEMTQRLIQEIATDPRYSGTRKAIEHYTALERANSGPQTKSRATAGPEPTKARLGVGPLSLATINLTATSQAAANLAEKAAPGLHAGSAPAQFVRNAGKDIGTLGKAPFAGAYAVGDALYSDTKAQLHGDVSNKKSIALGKGIVEGIVEEVKHPVKALQEHPILTVLDGLGGVSAAARVSGAAARGLGKKGAPGVRGKLDEHSHTVRPPIALVDDAGQPVLVQRTYSKDLTRRAAQTTRDRGREQVMDGDGKPVFIEDRGRKVPVLKASEAERERHFKKRGDMVASRANLAERKIREETVKASRIRGLKGRHVKDIVTMAVEGTLVDAKNFATDLAGHRKKIAARIAAHENGTDLYKHSGDLKAAKARLALVDRVLNDPKAMAQGPAIIAEAERHGARLREGDAATAEAKVGEEAMLNRAALSTTALEHLGARHFTVEEHAALEREARKAETAAIAKYEEAKTPAGRQEALGDLQAAREARIAVSGREPEGVRKHEAAKHGHAAATSRLKRATEGEAKAMARVRDLTISHKSDRGREAHHGPVAAYYVGDRRFTLRHEAVAAAKAAGIHVREIRRVATTAGEAKRVGELSQARRALAAAKKERRDAADAVRKTEQAVKGNKLPEANAALRYGEDNPAGKPAGAFLSNKDIEDFLTSRGRDPKTVAYLTHRQDTRGARAHHAQLRPGSRPNLDSTETRTGAAYLDRVTESSEALLRDVGVRQAVQLNKAKALDQVVHDHGLRHPAWAKAQDGKPLTKGEERVVREGGLFTAKEALETATRLENDTGQRFVPMTAYQARLSADTKRIIREDLQGPGGMETLSERLLNDRVLQPSVKPDGKTRNVVLVPAELVERLEAHLRPAGEVERFFQYLNKPFRFAVLPQPRWLTGNFGESYLVRLPTVGSGVNIPGLIADVVGYKRYVEAMRNGTPEMRAAAEQISAQQHGSGLFVGGKAGGVHRAAEDVMPEFAQRAYGRMVAKLPATRQMVELSRSAIHWIAMPLHAFFWVNLKGIESPAQKIAFGHTFRRDLQAITGSWIKSITSAREASADAAKGLVNTPAQHRFMNDQYELLGKYQGFNPALRAFTQSVAPFLPWMLNAARFVYWTMPAHNTVKTALLVKAAEVVEKDWEEIHRTVPPGGLKDAIPGPGGAWFDIARYTPYGLTSPIANGGNLSSITGQFTPQLGGAVNALGGRDPFGRPLKLRPTAKNPKGKATTWDMVKIGGYDLLEATFAYMSTGRRLREGGETAFSDSTFWSPKTKPGTSHGRSAFSRTFNPLNPTYLHATGTETVTPLTRFEKARDQGAAESAQDRQDALADKMYESLDSDSAAADRQEALLDSLYGG